MNKDQKISDERVCICGKKAEIIEKFLEIGLSSNTSEKILDFLTREQNVLGEDETCEVHINTAQMNNGMMGFMTMDCNYYINARVGTIFLVSVLIDNHVGLPITSGYLTIRGMNRLVEKIDEETGTKCILLEILRTSEKSGKDDILTAFKGECCNNYLNCCFRDENRCKCTNIDVKEIMERLASAGILRRERTVFHYDPIGAL